MATNKIQTYVRLNEPLYDQLKEIAVKDGRSLNSLIERFLTIAVDHYNRFGVTYEKTSGWALPGPDHNK